MPRCAFQWSLVLMLGLAVTACSARSGGRDRRAFEGGAAGAGDSQEKPVAKQPAKAKDKEDKPPRFEEEVVDLPPDSENPGGGDESDTCYKGDAAICAAEFQIFELTNQVRAARGLKPLVYSPKIAFVSRDWSSEQAKDGSIGHSGFPSQRRAAYQREFGRAFDSSAENVAMTYGSSEPAREFVDMWVGSAGHLRNMLGNYKRLGVGLAKSGNGGWYATQIFGDE